jgi:serine protein kinase
MKMNSELIEALKEAEKSNVAEEIITFNEYLEVVRKNPWVTRNMMQLMHDMMLSSGVDHTISAGKPVVHKYNFFEDSDSVGEFIVFGQQKAKENLVERISNASRGQEASKRLWILLGPPGSSKSRSMEAVKTSLNRYSQTDSGRTYYLLLPTVNEKLKDRAILEEDGIYYVPAPQFERPLQIVPDKLRGIFADSLNETVDVDAKDEFLKNHPHYDDNFLVQITGRVSPYVDYVIKEFMEEKKIDFSELIPYLKVKRMIFDAKTKTGIGSYTPRDEKSQEAGSLVGNLDYTLLPKFGSESHPLVHDYQGELCAGANGFVEIHEILKLSDKFLYELLFATHDRFFKPEGQAPIPFNGVIIGHTNFHEYTMFMENNSFEALRTRTVIIEMPFSTNFKEEEHIYTNTYSNEKRLWTPEKKHVAHTSPHSLEFLSLASVMSRLYPSRENKNLSLLQKALLYAGRVDTKVDSNMAKKVIEEFTFEKPSEGTFGLDPRFIQNVFETAEHFQINEFLATVEKMKEEGGESSLLGSISLSNPCVTPMDLFLRAENMIKDTYASQKTTLSKLIEKVLPESKRWIQSQIANDVYSAILRDVSIVDSTWKKYTDHVKAFATNRMVKHDVTHQDVKPDEKFMQAIEQYIGIAERDVFRKELSDALGSASPKILLSDEPSYQAAIKRYVFENEFNSGENMKLLGWIKSGTSSAEVNSKEQEQLNDTIKYLINNFGYCGKCAHQALVITANSSSIIS